MHPLNRLRQGIADLTAAMTADDWALVDRYLTMPERRLFEGMEAADQRHSVGVLSTLLETGAEDPDLLKAGLLHDVGKSVCKISVVHRTLAVLAGPLVGGSQPAVAAPRTGWWLPFHVIANHPRIGASILARAGCPERVWRLAELHGLEPQCVGEIADGEWVRSALAALRSADNRN